MLAPGRPKGGVVPRVPPAGVDRAHTPTACCAPQEVTAAHTPPQVAGNLAGPEYGKTGQPCPRSRLWGAGSTWVRGRPVFRRGEQAMSQFWGGVSGMSGRGRGWSRHCVPAGIRRLPCTERAVLWGKLEGCAGTDPHSRNPRAVATGAAGTGT